MTVKTKEAPTHVTRVYDNPQTGTIQVVTSTGRQVVERLDGFTSTPNSEGRYVTDLTCDHIRLLSPGSGMAYTTSGARDYHTNYPGMAGIIDNCKAAVDSFIDFGELDFQKNNNFNALVTAGEIITGGGNKLAKKLVPPPSRFARVVNGYAGAKWGLLPFASDVQSIYNSYKDVMRGGISKELNTPKRIEKTFPVNFPREGTNPQLEGSFVVGNLRLSGVLTVGNAPSTAMGMLPILLDELGVHPDLNTLWDLVPGSFVLDYFLPVGDMLSNMHPRGWFKPSYSFTGRMSWQLQATACIKTTYLDKVSRIYKTFRYYNRGATAPGRIPSKYSPKDIDWPSPSVSNIFDAAVVAGLMSGRIR